MKPTFTVTASALAEGTAASIGATYSDVVAAQPRRVRKIYIQSTMDGDVLLSLDGGTTDHIRVPEAPQVGAADREVVQIELNFDSEDAWAYAGQALQAKDGASAPTAGTLSITIFYNG